MRKFFGKISRIIFLITAFIIFIVSAAESADNSFKNTVVAKVADSEITYGELEAAFKKNLNRRDEPMWKVPEDSIFSFLDLYINYKLKVQDAVNRGYAKDPEVQKDIEQNRKILAESFYYDKHVTEPGIERLMKYRQKELQIAVIVFTFPAHTDDTLPTYQRALRSLELLKKGVDFAKVAKDSSDDRNTGDYGGVLKSFITGGSIQKPIEEVVYSLKPGEMFPELIRTKYGYFIVKLVREVPRIQVKASHILVSKMTVQDSIGRIKKADELIAKLNNGADFSIVAEEFSDDPKSAMNGGDLGVWVSRATGINNTGRSFAHGFEDELFSLKDGEISGKVYTDYGIHIIRRDSTKKFDSEAEYKDVKNIYRRLYFEAEKAELLDSLKHAHKFVINDKVFKELLASVDTSAGNFDNAWTDVSQKLMKKELYRLDGEKTTVSEFLETVKSDPVMRGISLNESGLKRMMNKIIDPKIFKAATKGMENKYPDFRRLMNEFRDGILLFKVEKLEVWDNLKFDSAEAKKYFDKLDKDYWMEEKYDISEIYVLSDTIAQMIYDKLINKEHTFEEMAKVHTQRSNYREKKGHWGVVSPKVNLLAQIVEQKGIKKEALLEPEKVEKGYSVIKVNKYLPKRVKTFEEAIPEFAPEFQDMMQKKYTDRWLDKLREEISVEIYKDKITEINEELKENNHK